MLLIYILIFYDNICIAAETEMEHGRLLEQVLKILCEAGLKIDLQQTKINF